MLKRCVDLAWHGEIAERQPALYAIVAAAWLAHGRAVQSCLIMMAISFFVSALFGPVFSTYCSPDRSMPVSLLSRNGSMMGRNQVVYDVEESGILGILSSRDGLILLAVAELTGAGEDREFTETPVLIAKRAGGFLSGTIRPESVSFALLRMADRGVIVELELSRHLVVGRIADYHRLVEIAMD